ncbi:MAG: hydantoinase/oxoprolinase family protein [SAR324 cluster bacterium]|nr:hydantoinase/oxoprolinase family protein [SAR324 cluster bacterium]
MREYERFSTTAANAYIQPVISAYLERLRKGLHDDGFRAPMLMMLSGGGLTTSKRRSISRSVSLSQDRRAEPFLRRIWQENWT